MLGWEVTLEHVCQSGALSVEEEDEMHEERAGSRLSLGVRLSPTQGPFLLGAEQRGLVQCPTLALRSCTLLLSVVMSSSCLGFPSSLSSL